MLITGVAGYIGSHTALAFQKAGWHVIGIDNLSVGCRDAVPVGVEFHQIDCQSPRLVDFFAGRKIDGAVHFAGLIRVDESVIRPLDYYRANFCHAGALFGSLAALKVPAVVFSSTAAIYGNENCGPVNEQASAGPTSPYGRSKLAAEWQLHDLCATVQMRYVTLRYFNVAGADSEGRAGPRPGATHLIKAVSEAAVGLRDGVTIFGDDYDTPDGTGVRDFIHVSDLAFAHVAAIDYLLRGGSNATMNCGYGRGFSVREVIDVGLSLSERPFRVTVGPRRPGDAVSVVANSSALKCLLNWVPRHDNLETILRTAINWERICLSPPSIRNRDQKLPAGLADVPLVSMGGSAL